MRADRPDADIDDLDADVAGIHQLVVELQEGDRELDRSVRTHLALLNGLTSTGSTPSWPCNTTVAQQNPDLHDHSPRKLLTHSISNAK